MAELGGDLRAGDHTAFETLQCKDLMDIRTSEGQKRICWESLGAKRIAKQIYGLLTKADFSYKTDISVTF